MPCLSVRSGPWLRVNATSWASFMMSALHCGVPVTRTPRPRVISTIPSSRWIRSARRTALRLMSRTAARSMEGGKPLSGRYLAVTDGPTNLRCNLVMEGSGLPRSTFICIVLRTVALSFIARDREGSSEC